MSDLIDKDLYSNLRRQSTEMTQANKLFKENNSVDPRKMRRIIAEDPEWNLMTVPLLSELCTKSIVKNFHSHPRHDELPLKYRKKYFSKFRQAYPLKLLQI